MAASGMAGNPQVRFDEVNRRIIIGDSARVRPLPPSDLRQRDPLQNHRIIFTTLVSAVRRTLTAVRDQAPLALGSALLGERPLGCGSSQELADPLRISRLFLLRKNHTNLGRGELKSRATDKVDGTAHKTRNEKGNA